MLESSYQFYGNLHVKMLSHGDYEGAQFVILHQPSAIKKDVPILGECNRHHLAQVKCSMLKYDLH